MTAMGASRPLNFRATTLPGPSRDVGHPDSQWQLYVDLRRSTPGRYVDTLLNPLSPRGRNRAGRRPPVSWNAGDGPAIA